MRRARVRSRAVSVLFNEPKLLKFSYEDGIVVFYVKVSVLFNEPKLLKSSLPRFRRSSLIVSVLFNEPKLLKCHIILLFTD